MSNRAVRIRDEVAVPGHVVKSATGSLKAHERFVWADATLEDTPAAITLTLPPAPECIGLIFTIFTPTGGSYAVTVTSADGQFDTFTALSGNNDGIALFCDGRCWYQIGAQT